MQKLERRKPYKAIEPLVTINAARQLLAACDLFSLEYHQMYPIPGVHCCRVFLGDEDLVQLNIGSNGKGMTSRYALASAYGEILERLQNSILFPIRQLKFATKRYLGNRPVTSFRERLEKEDLLLDYHFGPDEVYCDIDAVVEGCNDVLEPMLRVEGVDKQKKYLHEAFGQEEIACLPYYSVLQQRVRLLPIELIWNTCGTNGMCAGNTPKEALVQGISEVFERMVIRTIYQEKIAPPTVPAGYFQGTAVLERLQRMEKEAGIRATIKDCSLRQGLPVIGLLLEQEATGRYTFHVGADPCPITALERCLTEIYQGRPEDVGARFHPRQNGDAADDKAALNWRTAYYQATSGGLGQWPESIFATKSTYPFTGFLHSVSDSDSGDLAYLVRKVKDLGLDIFVRDVSYLGFPTYQVYIPGFSEVDFVFEETDFPNWMAIVRQHTTLLNLGQASEASISKLASAVANTDALVLPISFEPRRWFLSNLNPTIQQLSKDYLLTLFYTRVGDYDRAAGSLARFMQSAAAQSGPMLYYKALQTYLQAKAAGTQQETIRHILVEEYAETVAARVLEDFGEREKVFERSCWPSCFDCNRCKATASCRYFAILRKAKTVQRKFQASTPNQQALSTVFGDVAKR